MHGGTFTEWDGASALAVPPGPWHGSLPACGAGSTTCAMATPWACAKRCCGAQVDSLAASRYRMEGDISMADDHPAQPDTLQQEIAAMEARLAELRRLADRERIAQSGAGGLAIDGTAGGAGSVVVGRDVYGHISHVYQSSPGRKALSPQDVERILGDYLRWVHNAYSKARLYGLESSLTAQGDRLCARTSHARGMSGSVTCEGYVSS